MHGPMGWGQIAHASCGLETQKWSKGKLKEKVNNLVLFDQVRLGLCNCSGLCWPAHPLIIAAVWQQGTYDKMIAEVPKYKMITASILSDRLRVSSSQQWDSWVVHGCSSSGVGWATATIVQQQL
jgi:S25 ribosomal protein